MRLYGLAFAGLKLTASMDEPARCASADKGSALPAVVFLTLVIVAGFVGESLKPLRKLQAVS